MFYDVLIIGAGPSGLSAAICLKQLSAKIGRQLSVCVLEKASTIGAHSLSGAIFDIRTLDELLPNWTQLHAPIHTAVHSSRFLYLMRHHAIPLPLPPTMRHQGDYIISLSELCSFLASQAEALGVEIYPNFAASEILYDNQGAVRGVLTGVMGLNAEGKPSERYEPGIEMLAHQTILAEGCRGSLSQLVIKHFALATNSDPQLYGLGIKELWKIDQTLVRGGQVMHTIGWPLGQNAYGGGFLYCLTDGKVAVGFVTSLDYANPYLSPFEEFQRFKTHPIIRKILQGGQRIAYGARTLAEGGIQALPKLTFPGGVIVGDAAGFLNVPRIKGIHTAMKSGMLAAHAVHEALISQRVEANTYDDLFRQSWLYDELWAARNIRLAFLRGLYEGLIYSALDMYILKGHAPWTLHSRKPDHTCLRIANHCKPITYPKPDHCLTFDRTSSVFLANVVHREGQPVHLQLKDATIPISKNLALYDSPEVRYCPAQVYEINKGIDQPTLQIHAQNCIHCKACDIKDPTQNIIWTTPEGGSGPNYSGM
ncbi:MAG: electron transfer flavoprotein-ubiquinone oxidoreductase [Neisseriales bacterium]|nr:MAG: electron transfer flavoprotein-ubiquinone oxidoreductase [Neisseriales bacterium]